MYGERERPVKALDPWSSAATCSEARPGAPGTPFSDVGCALVKDAQRPFCCVSLGALLPSQPGHGGTAVRRRAHVGNAETRPRASALAPGTSGQLRARAGAAGSRGAGSRGAGKHRVAGGFVGNTPLSPPRRSSHLAVVMGTVQLWPNWSGDGR